MASYNTPNPLWQHTKPHTTITTTISSKPDKEPHNHHHHHHHHKHQGFDPLIRSISRVTAARANASSVFQLFSFPVICSGMISNRFSFVAFFASVKASSACINLSCLVCLWSVVRGICSHKGCSLPEVSVTSFLPLQFFVFVRLLESNLLTHIKM